MTATLELATSSAPLDSSPRKNWVEKSGGLPPGIRKVARALKKKHPEWTLSHCIAVAQSMSEKWAAKGSVKGARNVAGMKALQARNKARQVATSHPVDGAAVVALSNEVLVELARIVRTEAGARHYGAPIGSVIGQRGPHARVRGTAAREARSTAGRVAVAEQGLAESTARIRASGQVGGSKAQIGAAKAKVAEHAAAAEQTRRPSAALAGSRAAATSALSGGNRGELRSHLGALGLKPAEAERVAGQLLRMDAAKARRRLDVLTARSQIAQLDQRRRRGHLSLADHAKARTQLQQRLGHAQNALRAA